MSPYNYLVALVDGGGTVPPELGAVRRLVDRGHNVMVLTEASTLDEVRATGATPMSWTNAPNRRDRSAANDPWRDWEVKSVPKLFDRLIETQLVGPAPRYCADVTAAITEARPDAVLCSQFAFGAMVAAEAAAVPFAVPMPNIYMLPAKNLPPMGIGFRPAHNVIGRIRDRIVGGFSTRLWDKKGLPGLNDLRSSVGLVPVAHFWDQVHRADAELIMTSAAFDFPAVLPETARYVGPVLDDPAWAEPWVPPAGDAPLVLVALSSTFQDQVDCLQRIADGLGQLPVRAVLTAGPAIDSSTLRAPSNVYVVASAPHSQVLKHATAAVTHGGHGSVVKSLAAGVPMLVMHHGRDQADNAARVTARGAGIALKRTAKPAAIAKAVKQLLDDSSYAAQAAKLGEALRRDAESGTLVAELERLPIRHPVL
jgi:MGT family glycosyltransferase